MKVERINIVDDELHDLKLRFELLEGDRKAYYESSQYAIRQNKEEISKIRKQNKQLAEVIAKFKKVNTIHRLIINFWFSKILLFYIILHFETE